MISSMFRFTAQATFIDGSIKTTADDPDSLFAVDPDSAARKWFFRLSAAQRSRCVEIRVGAWILSHRVAWSAYSGPDVAWAVEQGHIVRFNGGQSGLPPSAPVNDSPAEGALCDGQPAPASLLGA